MMIWMVAAGAQESSIDLSGELAPGEPTYVLVDFEVPPGIAEIEVRHESLTPGNVIDWGLQGPNGVRGWGGGNEEPAIVGALAASRSYLPGEIEPGTWQVVLGKARLTTAPYAYALEVVLRDAPTLAPQSRVPYTASPPLESGRRWYAGDFHVHSSESGDANASLDAIAELARSRGLDFVAITDHNVVSHLDLLVEAQARHPDVLFIPAMEFTTYAGHANAIGNTARLDARIGLGDATLERAIGEARASGALFSINHPALDLGDRCIGCKWEQPFDPATIDAVEIATGGLSPAGALFVEAAIAFWDGLCAEGHPIAALGGSDDHRAGVGLGLTGSPIGDPTTLVEADALSVDAILAGIRAGRTVVKLQGPADPMVELSADGVVDGHVSRGRTQRVTARVTGGAGRSVRLVRDGVVVDNVPVDTDPFELTRELEAPELGQSRVRAEVWEGSLPRVVTSHVWLADSPVDDGPRCGCATGGASGALALVAALLVGRRRGASRQ